MALKLRLSTASQEIPLGCFVDSTDGNTEKSALTIANTDIKLWKMGATTLASKNSGGATYISNGIYQCTLDATDTNTLGGLIIFVHVATALAVRLECEVLPAVVYDAWIAGTDNFDVNAMQFAGQTITAGAGVTLPSSVASPTNITAGVITTVTNLTNAPTAGDLTATMKTSVTTAATAATPIAASVTGNVAGNVTGSVGSVIGAVGSVTGAVGSVAGSVAGNVTGSVGSVVGAVGSVSGSVGSVVGAVGSVAGNVVGSVASVVGAVGSVTAAVTTSAADRIAVADTLLDRDMSTGVDSGSPTVRTPRQALRFSRNKWSIAAGTLTVTKEDDSTPSWSATVATTAGNPVSTVDPA